MFWDEKKIGAAGPTSQQDGVSREQQEADVAICKEDMKLASAFIRSTAAWCYSQMFLIRHFLVVAIEDFCESCPCHRDIERILGGPQKKCSWSRANLQSLWRARRHSKFRKCVFKGRVVGEVAAGALMKLFRDFKSMATTELMYICGQLSSADRDKVMMDFERGCQHIFYVLTLKLAHWQDNPWRLLSLANPIVEVARENCAAVYAKAQVATSDVLRAKEHRLTQLLCYPGGFLHAQFMRFLQGEDLESLELLSSLRARMKLISVLERYVESWHGFSEISSRLGPNASAAFLSVAQRSGQLQEFLDEDLSNLEKLADVVAQCGSGAKLLRSLHLQGHPQIQKTIHAKSGKLIPDIEDCFSGKQNWAVLNEVVYHSDPATVYNYTQSKKP